MGKSGKVKKVEPHFYGGQAVMEGVMMRGKEHYCLAVRNPAGEIECSTEEVKPGSVRKATRKIPVVRGVVGLGSSMAMGYKVIHESAVIAGLEDAMENPSKFEKWLEEKLGDKLGKVLIVFAVCLSLVFSVALFMVLPTWLSKFLTPLLDGNLWALGIIEGIVRFVIFVGYLLLIAQMKDAKRLLQYHGAEHKVINCYEALSAGDKAVRLTPEDARPFSRLHRRCGTSFLLFVMIVSMIFFLFVRTDVIWLRVASRILFVPFIAGISWEIIKWAGVSKSPIVKILSWPGFMMQKITTVEPDDGQIEVAIAALEGVLVAEGVLVLEEEVLEAEASEEKEDDEVSGTEGLGQECAESELN